MAPTVVDMRSDVQPRTAGADRSDAVRAAAPPDAGRAARADAAGPDRAAAIRVRGARQHNLRDVDVAIPRRAITVVTGVSGSGKSSLVFDTIAAEAQRQLNETFTSFVRNRLPSHGRPDVDRIDNLSAPVVVSQRRIGGNARSTVGTITDTWTLLRLLFSRIGQPYVGESTAFSFNDPAGMCPRCDGLGRTTTVHVDELIDWSASLDSGAIRHPSFAPGKWYWRYYAESGLFDTTLPLRRYGEVERAALLHGGAAAARLGTPRPPAKQPFEGVLPRFERIFVQRDRARMREHERALLDRFTTMATCPACGGARLNDAARRARIDGHGIADLAAMELRDLAAWLCAVDAPAVADVLAELAARLDDLVGIGLGYLTLDRPTATLSGGESQRVKMVRHLRSSLIEMLSVLDEPSIGLHPADVAHLTDMLRRLVAQGNTVLVVEHDTDVIAAADHVIDMGPGAGSDGGMIVHQGDVDSLRRADTPTGRQLARQPVRTTPVRAPTGPPLRVRHASAHNLADVSVDVPTGVLTVVTGVAGAGKSTLIHDCLLPDHPDAVVVDQSRVATSRRSYPATHTGVFGPIRRLFAAANGVSPSLFSANADGACPQCRGLGEVHLDLAFMDDITVRCDACDGRRFADHVLIHTYGGLRIDQVLDLTVDAAVTWCAGLDGREPRRIAERLAMLSEVGLGYLRLGQSLSSLSGGEAQRLRLAEELGDPAARDVLDEPTTGLHGDDVQVLLEILDRLVGAGATVVVVEHDLDVVRRADWVIDMGPGGGHDGGQVVFAGRPDALAGHPTSLTAAHLRRRTRGDR